MSKHEGIKYPCDQCEYSAVNLSNLKQHKEIKHEGIRYPCDNCDYSASTLQHLKQHKEIKHAHWHVTSVCMLLLH